MGGRIVILQNYNRHDLTRKDVLRTYSWHGEVGEDSNVDTHQGVGLQARTKKATRLLLDTAYLVDGVYLFYMRIKSCSLVWLARAA